MTDEDLTPFRDDPLLLALRAPAEPGELAGEETALAMFRGSLPTQARRRRALRRATIGGAGIVLGLTMTTGVAAAYTTGLPDPVQDVVHAAIDPLPLPAPPTAAVLHARRQLHREQVREKVRAHRSAAPSTPQLALVPRPTPDATATHQSEAPTGIRRPSSRPSASATAAPPPPVLSASVSRRVVPVHESVVLAGRLTRGGQGVAGRTVYAGEQVAGESTWRRVAKGTTASDGTVSLTVPPLTSNVRLRLVTAGGVISRPLPVAVVPKLTLSRARSGADRIVTVTADGGRPGNAVRLLRRDGDAWTQIASTALDGNSKAQFTVPGPGAAPVRYLVRLLATKKHAAASVQFVVPKR